ncbi:MAG: FAD-dependent oxidoreductase [Proteobacteria bacterium]|nr:FAD-dependent oxidoreductase [Pseudomonadota bacterium]MBU1583255.1 FAD-dependent oxidoreductase [Pseudomonadota bacterium]MBU2455346.1 FAD-dependent oxidoreductase [Pseudomonadota bacterium]MBU2629349.1 FAD-dependent oxidoreductase [Pseudomonadota bacterium]
MLTFKVGTLAKHLGVHRNTVTNWIKKKKLNATPTAAKRYFISKIEFIEFCEKEQISKKAMELVLKEVSDQANDKKNSIKPTRLPGEDKQIGAVMVVGGGIAGIQAAMDLADSGYYVYIVEKTAGIGGTMAQLDKTFPTNDCASCIILPKLVECSRHRNIELLTLAQVDDVQGSAGHFTIRVKKQPRYIDMGKCIACGICAQKCPINVKDAFNFNISKKKAVYIKYDQSVPLKYAIEPKACIYFTMGKCRACEKFCPTGAVDFTQTRETVTIKVGAVILAPGFKPFDPSKYDFFGYGFIQDVVTSLEYERLLSVSGPNRGRLARPSDRTEPRKIAWLQCVGSRNHNNCGNSYCSSICCMSAVKQSMTSLEHIKGIDFEQTIFFMDLRSHGKESERYFERAKKENIRFVRALPHTMEPGKDGTGVKMRYMNEDGRVMVETFDMAVLSIGFEAPEDALILAEQFDIELDQHHFAKTSCFEPVESSRQGVYVIGAFQSPKAIARSVVQASAAAAAASRLLVEERQTLVKTKGFPKERNILDEQPSVGVFVCSCGVNIAGIVDVAKVVEYAAQLPHVSYVENNLFSCSADAQESIIEKIHEFALNRIVIAACTPRTHEHLFQETLKSARLNGFMAEMANIRNQNSWVHQKDSIGATQKAKDQVRMAVAKVAHNYPLQQESIKVVQRALVVGGGVVGMNCAVTLAGLGIETVLIEKGNILGGNALKLETCFNGEAVYPMVEDLISRVNKDKNITVYKRTTLESVSGSVGHFKGQLNIFGEQRQINFGAAIMATGAKEASPIEYLYGKESRVMTQTEFDGNILYNPDEVEKTKSVVFIQCVGSREPERPYCSRICCIHSVKAAIWLKQSNPEVMVYILYRDIRTYGEWEAYYKEARDLGVLFIRYETSRKPLVKNKDSLLEIEVFDPIVRRQVKILADYLVLASSVIANDNKNLADLFKFSVNSDGFFYGAHPKLKPVNLSVAGLFLAGLCNYPKPLDESIEEARAAACKAFVLLSQTKIKSEAIKSFVTKHCDGCALCIDVCPFNALSVCTADATINQSKVRVSTDPALCQGCGLCAATCPKEGILVHGFTMRQLMAQVKAAMNTDITQKECS